MKVKHGCFVVLITALSGSAFAASAWTGGDDGPTHPLACDATPAVNHPSTYNGGKPTNPKDLAGKPIRVIDVPKLIGIDYFKATADGAAAAAKELGNVQVKTDGPTSANVDQEITFIDNAITSGVDGILVSSNDSDAITPVLKKAMAKGIRVIGYDADSTPPAREWFVQQVTPNAMAKTLIDRLVIDMGEKGSFAIITSSFNAPNQSRWIAEMSAYAAKCHPKLHWLETVEGQENTNVAFTQAQTLVSKYGDQLNGILTMTASATPGAAEAVKQAGMCGKISVDGLGTPNSMKPYLANNCSKSFTLWKPVDLGYAAMQVMRMTVDGQLKPGATSVKAGRLGELQVINGSQILLGNPAVFTKENVNQYNF
jgi:ABC-type sugar transport system substrate-binding protein